mmetsp:Transcript_30542/g.34830  ORF Transcript_30542/g.34830 Transcript_30542/m.34830 type:complete len:331 (+) Transcript_30542:132-1124(+)|eukprot:CAMPEP_0194142252 /NCGR_PEP_ID=MMETSP0152-20130528/11570_1 /TAXON_ID=1049557 /ORGANISM="Thalassiothrix antarctica, Strain L6-D1" /LENGTH=330 /DNA_ID=CAMNT_0038841161 /DNA_START=133 /DNA_END=1125 /DNA_ORIENTATION=-
MSNIINTINLQTGEALANRSPRFIQWVAFLIFSVVTLASTVEQRKYSGQNTNHTAWAVLFTSVIFTLSLIAVGMQLHPIGSTLIVGTKSEGITIAVLLCFWVGTVSIISNPRNNLAVDTEGAVDNGNLYYFSWAGFICSVMLLVNYLRAVFGVDLAGELRNRSERLTTWSALLASQLVVMGSSASMHDMNCFGGTNADKHPTYCARAMFGIVVGVMGTLMCLAVVGMKIASSSVPFLMECAFAIALTLLNAFAVAFLTSPEGPGMPLGNLYYFSWISLVCSALLIAGCFETFKSGGSAATNADSAGVQMGENGLKTDDIPVEDLDEDDHI